MVRTTRPGYIKAALNEVGWIEDEVVAAGHLRQGRGGFLGGFADMLPTPSKKLPRQFLLALTGTEVLVFKTTEVGGQEGAAMSWIKILEGVAFRCPIESVSISALEDGEKSRGATLTIEGESFPVLQAIREGDPNTEPLFAMLMQRSAAVA